MKADGSLYTTAIDHEGLIAITGTMSNTGNVIFDPTGGYNYINSNIQCQNFDETGGNVTFLGGSIELDNSALIICSGVNGGGQISVGGGLNGIGTPYNSQSTVMQRGALLIADASVASDGGQLVVWSDNTTEFYGSIFSRGGKNSWKWRNRASLRGHFINQSRQYRCLCSQWICRTEIGMSLILARDVFTGVFSFSKVAILAKMKDDLVAGIIL